ncbi:uncharacterized protein LOC108905193 [Anoplophora glabripennis]|uniref:uncharacterized protein LOC108905193 n=1 Tax=Anoplophora glabripennis TaxID=217634 RepID=UPI0008741A2D|nr:uncharacterized protein LOC108905193 [Anoplophora glabripennis]
MLDNIAEFRAETDGELTRNKHKKKFERLQQEELPKKRNTPGLNADKIVYNVSKMVLDEALKSVLSKGFNYAVTPTQIAVENIICGVEASIENMDTNIAETIQHDVSQIMRRAKPPKKNLTREETQDLRNLQKNTKILVLPVEGNATVVMNTQEYDRKIMALLIDPVYEPISTDRTTYLENTTKAKIKASHIRQE